MMDDYYNPMKQWQEMMLYQDAFRDMTEEERIKFCVTMLLCFLAATGIALFLFGMISFFKINP